MTPSYASLRRSLSLRFLTATRLSSIKAEAARLARAEEAARAFVLANSGLVEGTANFDAAVAAARDLARTF